MACAWHRRDGGYAGERGKPRRHFRATPESAETSTRLFLNFGKINRQRAKICADPLANSSPFPLSKYILLIRYPYKRRFTLLSIAYFQVGFKRLKIFICNRRVCLFFIRERARARTRENICKYCAFFFII